MGSLDRGGPNKGNVIKYGKAKKKLARAAKGKLADQNRARFGEAKTEGDKKKALLEKLQSNLDGAKRETPKGD